MAATNITYDRTKNLGINIAAACSATRDAADRLQHVLAVFATTVDGNGTDVSHFTATVAEGTFTTTAEAKKSWDSLKDLEFNLLSNSTLMTSITNNAAKHGIGG